MAVIAAAIINDGNAPQPYALVATRSPESDTWTPVEAVRPTLPYANANTARQLQDLMRNAVANGAAFNAARPNIDIGGHATIAYSGDETQAWFVGFATIAGRQAIAVAVVLENSNDPGLAADIGGTALAAAHEALKTN
jgi:penicillin-binding protein A